MTSTVVAADALYDCTALEPGTSVVSNRFVEDAALVLAEVGDVAPQAAQTLTARTRKVACSLMAVIRMRA